MDDRVTELEMKVAFLEDTINQLDQVVCEQRTLIEKLEYRHRQLADKHQDLVEKLESEPPGHEIPPHY